MNKMIYEGKNLNEFQILKKKINYMRIILVKLNIKSSK